MNKRNRLDNLQPLKFLREVALADKSLCVKIDRDIDGMIRTMPERSAWLREAIETAAIEQGLVTPKKMLEKAIMLNFNKTYYPDSRAY